MVDAMIIVKGDREVMDLFKNVSKIPKYIADANYDFARVVRNRVRKQLTINGTRWTGRLWSSIEAKRVSGNRSVVKMAKYGEFLHRMQPHNVALKRGRRIVRWAREAPNSPWRGLKPRELPKAIYVRPHPFFDDAFNTARKDFRGLLKQGLNKALRGA